MCRPRAGARTRGRRTTMDQGGHAMKRNRRRLRTPRERVGVLPNASLPPPLEAGGENPEDTLLLRALVDGDEAAFERVLDLYFPAMLRLALVYVDGRATAEEVIQETWLAAIQGIERFEGRSSVKTWLFRILRNIARARGKRDARMRPMSEFDVREADLETGSLDNVVGLGGNGNGHAALWTATVDPAEEVLARELAARIERAINALPPRQREVIVLRDVEGWSAEDVCNAMGISETNQRVLLHRARGKVRRDLRRYLADEEHCADEDEAGVS